MEQIEDSETSQYKPDAGERSKRKHTKSHLLILYCVGSNLVLHFKFIDARLQASNIFILNFVSCSSILAFRYYIFLFLHCLLTSTLASFRLSTSTFLWLWFLRHCILACFFWSKNGEHSSSNRGFCSLNSYGTKLFNWDFYIFFNVSFSETC
jgi:hypothetical protein